MARTFFETQLATYTSYHLDERNRATHFVGIPAIVFSLLLPLGMASVAGVSLAWIVAGAAVAGWVALHRTVGLAMIAMMLPMAILAHWILATYGTGVGWWLFWILFVGGWVFQLVGHVFEGRRPALVDNLFQAYIAPMFIMTEVLTRCGLVPELKRIVDNTPAPQPAE